MPMLFCAFPPTMAREPSTSELFDGRRSLKPETVREGPGARICP